MKKTLPALSLGLAVLLGAAACGGEDGGAASAPPSQSQSKQSGQGDQGGAAGLADVPDVVAEVNGEQISKKDFAEAYKSRYQQAMMQSQTSGQAVDEDQLKQQVVDSMVGTTLLIQEAGDRGFEASDAQVDKRLTDLAGQNQMKSADQLLKAMKKQGMSEKRIRSEVADQLRIDRLLKAEGADRDPSEKQLRKMYEQAKKQAEQQAQQQGGQQQQVPPFGKVKPQLKEQAKSQQRGEVAQSLVNRLREQGDVTVNL